MIRSPLSGKALAGRFEDSSEVALRHWATIATVLAVSLTVFLSVLSRQSTRKAEEDNDWVDHTHAVQTALQTALGHAVDTETGARGFAVTGEESFLEPYWEGQRVLAADWDTLQHLTADNASQQKRLELLKSRMNLSMESTNRVVAERRQTGMAPGRAEFLEGKQRMDAVRATVTEMQSEETRLLDQRMERTYKARRLTEIIESSTALVGVIFLVFAGFSIRRQINLSVRMREQLRSLNASLERRSAESRKAEQEASTASLQSRKRAEEARDRLTAVIESCDDAIISKNLDGVIDAWNPGAEKLFGYSSSEAIGKPIRMLLPPDHAEEESEILARIRRGVSVDHFETVRVRKDGRRVDVSVTISPVRDRTGTVVGASKIARNISERKQAEAEIRLSRERLALAQKAGHSGTFDWDLPNKINRWSPEVEEVYGIAPGGFGGTYENWEALVVPEDLPAAKQAIEESLKTGELASEWRIRRRNDGEIRWVTSRAKVIFDEAGRPERMLGLSMDVTERKRAEEEVHRLNAELEQRVIQRTAQLEASNKELEAFTYSVSHDLRAPLRHISGFSKLLTEEYGSTLAPEAQHHLHRIAEGTRRMGLLVDDLLNLGRIGRHEVRLQVTGLNSVVNETLADLQAECEGRQLEWKMGTLPFVECDPALMKQVFQNLLSNAVKFTRPRNQAVIEVGQEDQDGVAVIFVRDNGVGFNMKYSDKLFGVFQRLHRVEDFEGTGVGLATVQRIIQKHGGRIWAEAELDKGATFFFTLGTSEKTRLKTKAAAAGDNA